VGQFVLLPAAIRTLATDYPDFELEVSELTTEQQMSCLAEGKGDALLMVGSLPVKGLHFDPIVREPLVAMVSRESPLAERTIISVEDLRHTNIIASRKDCRFHQPLLHKLLAPYGITPRIVESPQSCSVQLAYAAAGEGIAFTTSSMATCAVPHVVALPFAGPLPQMQLGLAAMESNESAALDIFRNVVMDCTRSTLTQHESTLPPPASLRPRSA
jgi:DNA-binding transcriptional LysR family regulator